jgi:hypothetical protein
MSWLVFKLRAGGCAYGQLTILMILIRLRANLFDGTVLLLK